MKIIKHMGRHTTQFQQLVNKLPHYIGYSDSCGIVTGGGMNIWPKQYRPYHLAIIVATKGKWTIQSRHPYHQWSRAGRYRSQLAGYRTPHIQPSKYPHIPLLWQQFGGGVDKQANIRFLPSIRTYPPLLRHLHPCNTIFTSQTHHNIRIIQRRGIHHLPFLLKMEILCC